MVYPYGHAMLKLLSSYQKKTWEVIKPLNLVVSKRPFTAWREKDLIDACPVSWCPVTYESAISYIESCLNSYFAPFAITLCETQLSAGYRSFICKTLTIRMLDLSTILAEHGKQHLMQTVLAWQVGYSLVWHIKSQSLSFKGPSFPIMYVKSCL